MTETALRAAAERALAGIGAVLDEAQHDGELLTPAERTAISVTRFALSEIADGDRTARPQTGPLDSGEVRAVG